MAGLLWNSLNWISKGFEILVHLKGLIIIIIIIIIILIIIMIIIIPRRSDLEEHLTIKYIY